MNRAPTTDLCGDATLRVFMWAFDYALVHFNGDRAKADAWLAATFSAPDLPVIHAAIERERARRSAKP